MADPQWGKISFKIVIIHSVFETIMFSEKVTRKGKHDFGVI